MSSAESPRVQIHAGKTASSLDAGQYAPRRRSLQCHPANPLQANFMPAAVTHLPSFPITNIGFSIQYSRQFLTPQTPCISFNMLLAALVTPLGRKFIRKAKAENRAVYAWTVNDKAGWEWCIQHRLDGVISDDPKAYLEYLEEREKKDGVVNWGWKDLQKYLKVALFVHVFEILYWFGWGYGGVVKQLMAEKKGAGRG